MWNSRKFDQAVKQLPKLYSTENIRAEDKPIAMHLFIGGSDWYICEGDASEGLLFGFAVLNGEWQFAEWGYASIEELKELKIAMKGKDIQTGKALKMGFAEVDFDLHWKLTLFSQIPQVRKNLYPELSKEFKGSAKAFLKECLGEEAYAKTKEAGLLIEEPDGSLRAPLPGTPAYNFAKAEGMI